jgi:drug/metabolite transporter (DMT)-like permease
VGYLWAILAFVIWGFTSTVILRAVPLVGPAASLAGSVIGTLAMLAYVGPKRWLEVLDVARRHTWRLAGVGIGFAGCSLTYHWSIKTTTVANAALTHSLQSLLTVLLFIPLWGGPRPTLKGFAALLLGLGGLVVLLWPQLSWRGSSLGNLGGLALGTASAVFYSWNMVQLPYFTTRVKQDVLQVAVLAATTVFLLPVLFFADMPAAWDARGAAATLAFGLLNFALANVLFLRAIKLAPIGHIGTLAYLEPVVGIVAASMFLCEPMTAGVVLGGMLILVSGALVVLDQPGKSAE